MVRSSPARPPARARPVRLRSSRERVRQTRRGRANLRAQLTRVQLLVAARDDHRVVVKHLQVGPVGGPDLLDPATEQLEDVADVSGVLQRGPPEAGTVGAQRPGIGPDEPVAVLPGQRDDQAG
jgi:hypothetical protein